MAAVVGFSESPQPSADLLAVHPQAKYWMRMYPLREYGFFWHVEIEVKDVAKATDKALKIMKKRSGTLPQPLDSFPSSKRFGYQQLSYRIKRADAAKALEKLKQLGQVQSLSQKPNPIVGLPEEVEQKLAKLNAERAAARTALEKAPSSASAIAEILEHLEQARKAYQDSEDHVLFNIVLETPKK